MATNLPPFSETLDQYGVKFKYFFKALGEYLDLGHEVMYSTNAQEDPYHFLQVSDQYNALHAFYKMMERQALFEDMKFDDEDDEYGKLTPDQDPF